MPRGDRSPRVAHAASTRQRLVDAALELFGSNGYEATTTSEIAAAAGVSQRTFFRYFPTKQAVLFFGEDDFVRSFAGVFLSVPEVSDEVEAMAQAFVVLAPGVARLKGRIALYRQAIASSPVLLGHERRNHERNAEVLAQSVARRRGIALPDDSCRLLAAVGLLVMDLATTRWLSGRGLRGRTGSLVEIVEDEFARLRGLFA